MDAAVANLNPVLLLNNAILPQALDQHPKVNAQGMISTGKCLRRLKAEHVLRTAPAGGVDVKSLILALVKGATSTMPRAKQAAREGVERRVSDVYINLQMMSSCHTQPWLCAPHYLYSTG